MQVSFHTRILERFKNSLATLQKSRERLENRLDRLFEALERKKVRVSTDSNSLMMDMRSSERRIQEASENMLWLLDQSVELTRVSSLITSSLQLNVVLEEVMDTIIHLTAAERAYIVLRMPGSDEMEIAAARNWERESMTEDDVVFSRRVVELALEEGEAITTANAAEDTRFETAESIAVNNWRSILCVPLIYRDEAIGVLYADNPIQRGIFRPDSLPIIEAFAQQTAIAIQNARLYNTLERLNVQLQEANRLKSEFLGIVSHELRTPFSSINMAMQLFPKYGMDSITGEQLKVWEDLSKGIETADRLVSGLVTYAGLLSKQGTLELVHTDIATIIDDIHFDAERLARRRNITVHLEIMEQPLMAQIDVERFSEAIFHIVQNAIQYNMDGGTVWIRAGMRKEYLVVSVKDTGVGIAPEDQERIWTAFEQMSDAVKRGVEGLGIGLPLAKYVAQAHGGNIRLQSVVGEGSTFTLVVPVSH